MPKIDRAVVMAGLVALAVAALMTPIALLGMTSKTAIRAFGRFDIDGWLNRPPEAREN